MVNYHYTWSFFLSSIFQFVSLLQRLPYSITTFSLPISWYYIFIFSLQHDHCKLRRPESLREREKGIDAKEGKSKRGNLGHLRSIDQLSIWNWKFICYAELPIQVLLLNSTKRTTKCCQISKSFMSSEKCRCWSFMSQTQVFPLDRAHSCEFMSWLLSESSNCFYNHLRNGPFLLNERLSSLYFKADDRVF